MPNCDRCGRIANPHRMSIFNTDILCMDCLEKERKHKDYPKAAEAERKAAMSGDFNFQGIGRPKDL